VEDYVKCFYCGGGLRNWNHTDEPWIEHAKWFPRCAFVILNRGYNYVRAFSRRPVPDFKLLRMPLVLTDEGLSEFLCTPIVASVLASGANLHLVKHVLRRQIKLTGRNFTSTEELLKAVRLSAEPAYISSLLAPSSLNTEAIPSSEDELVQLKNTVNCKICLEATVEVAFIPCGHLATSL